MFAVILTAIQIEYISVRDRLKNLRSREYKGTIYEIGEFCDSINQKWDVAIAEIGRYTEPASLQTERAIRIFGPDVAFFVGVAGGLKDVVYGDVVAATKVYNYESGKAEEELKPRFEVYQSTHYMQNLAKFVAREDYWRILGHRAFVEPIASGAKLVASTKADVYKFLRLYCSDALAAEMEGLGFLTAAHANQGLDYLVVRGISDLVDKKEETDASGAQILAAMNAAEFTFQILSRYSLIKENPIKVSFKGTYKEGKVRDETAKEEIMKDAKAEDKMAKRDKYEVKSGKNLEEYVIPLYNIRSYLGLSKQASYIYNYAMNILNAKTAIIEKDYSDEEFLKNLHLISNNQIYECPEQSTMRIHLFSNSFSQKEFEKNLIKYEKNEIDKLGGYLGFVIVNVIKKDDDLAPSIGRTYLVPPLAQYSGENNRTFIINKHKVNLYGIPLEITTLPYQTNNQYLAMNGVIPLWIVNNSINHLFRTPRLSPLDIRTKATELVKSYYGLPFGGLTLAQMLAFLESIGLTYEILSIEAIHESYPSYKSIISDTIKALIPANIPLIAALDLKAGNIIDNHAAIISGYEIDSRENVVKIFVHDDQFGPFCSVANASRELEFGEWDCEWTADGQFKKVSLNTLIIPLPPKIKLSFKEIFFYFNRFRESYSDSEYALNLMKAEDYKAHLLEIKFNDKLANLKKTMPEYIWVISRKENGNSIEELLIDATLPYIRNLSNIFFGNSIMDLD